MPFMSQSLRGRIPCQPICGDPSERFVPLQGVRGMASVQRVVPRIPSLRNAVDPLSFRSPDSVPPITAVCSTTSTFPATKKRHSSTSSLDKGVCDCLNHPSARICLSIFVGSILGCALGYGIYSLAVSYQSQFGYFFSNSSISGTNTNPRELAQQKNKNFPFLVDQMSVSGRGKNLF